jgi:hypothetical protein
VLYSTDLQTINQEMGEFTGVFTNADGALFTETYNQLNALFATIPGNYAQNLRKMYLLNSNYADLSFLFTIHPGEKTNPHLSSEYLAVLETDNATPYYLNLHNGEVAHTLILGMTGSGNYIHLYHGNAALLTESLEVIQKTSAVILSALETPAEEEPTTELQTGGQHQDN